MMHTHLYRNSSNSFWSEDDEDEYERLNNDEIWQAVGPPPQYNTYTHTQHYHYNGGGTLGPPPPAIPSAPTTQKAYSNTSFWRKLFSSRMWKQCWGVPQHNGRRSAQVHQRQHQQLSKFVQVVGGGVSPTCSISSSYPQSSVSSNVDDNDDDASSVSSQSLTDEEDCRMIHNEIEEDPRSSLITVPLPPSGASPPRSSRPLQRGVPGVQRRSSRADSVSSANSRHRREKALLPPITDIYWSNHSNNSVTAPGMQRVVSALPTDDDDMPQEHTTKYGDDDDDDDLFQLSSSSSSSASGPRRNRRTKKKQNKQKLDDDAPVPPPADWMLEWAGSDERYSSAAEGKEDDTTTTTPIPPHPVLFTAGWAVINETSPTDTTPSRRSSTVCCVHVVLRADTETPCLWLTPQDDDCGRAVSCAPGDLQSGSDCCLWVRNNLALQPITKQHDTLLFWRMGLDAALRHNNAVL